MVGFDDSPIASVIRPGLSSLRQPIETVAARLIDLLLSGFNDAQHEPARVLLKPHLIVRESSDARSGHATAGGALSANGPRSPGRAGRSKQGLSDT